MEDIGLLLNYIEDEVRTKKGALFGSVNKDAILNYVQRIRESLPDALSEKRIREETLKAQNIIALAEKRREEMLSQNQIVVEATKRAEQILQETYAKQNEYATTTMQNIYKMLSDINDHLQVAKDSIEKAMKELQP
ncbi:MAG: hypothetical protein ACOYEC_01900 [Christensenellales bacterium]|jgi:lipopolysaccharide export LptBFGC system permease protein LptF|nr:hypothetical protein [Clostridiales bacterium]